MAGPYAAKSSTSQPRGLSLGALRLRFEENDYFASPGQRWFGWGPTWSRHNTYASLPEFQSSLGIDQGSRCIDPKFARFAELDLRLSSESMAALEQSYPRGPVPGVVLGLK